jgi:hypothetical protein
MTYHLSAIFLVAITTLPPLCLIFAAYLRFPRQWRRVTVSVAAALHSTAIAPPGSVLVLDRGKSSTCGRRFVLLCRVRYAGFRGDMFAAWRWLNAGGQRVCWLFAG